MSENLFQQMHLVWASIIALIIMWSGKVWKDWRKVKQALSYFKKAGNTGFNQYR